MVSTVNMPEAEDDKTVQAKVHEALEKHLGDQRAAAGELGMTTQDLRNKIWACPRLRLRWMKDEVAAPDEIDSMIERGVTPERERMALAIEREGERLRKGLNDLGLSDREMTMTLALQKFNREHFGSIMDIVNAGVCRSSIKLMTQIEQVDVRLEIVRAKLISMGDRMEEERDLWVMEEEKLSIQYQGLIDQLRKILATSFEGSKTLALIRFKLAGGEKKKKSKPGFQEVGNKGAIDA